MTADEVQKYARILANQTWCRYWLMWNDNPNNVKVAISCIGHDGKSHAVPDLLKHGFTQGEDFVYYAPRTNEDGTPYVSKL